MKKICLQAGHVGKNGGAPNELATNKRITDRLSALLRTRGFDIYQTDHYAYNDPKVTEVNYDLFLALHCDMDYPNDRGSGFADFPAEKDLKGNIQDYVNPESKRICQVINDYYFPEVKIKYVSHSNANTKYYYMWKYLTAKTPCVLIEMGQSVDPHDSVLLANTELIAGALFRAICRIFNVSYEINSTNPLEDTVTATEFNALKGQFNELKKTLDKRIVDFPLSLADCETKCQQTLIAYKEKVIKIINSN